MAVRSYASAFATIVHASHKHGVILHSLKVKVHYYLFWIYVRATCLWEPEESNGFSGPTGCCESPAWVLKYGLLLRLLASLLT